MEGQRSRNHSAPATSRSGSPPGSSRRGLSPAPSYETREYNAPPPYRAPGELHPWLEVYTIRLHDLPIPLKFFRELAVQIVRKSPSHEDKYDAVKMPLQDPGADQERQAVDLQIVKMSHGVIADQDVTPVSTTRIRHRVDDNYKHYFAKKAFLDAGASHGQKLKAAVYLVKFHNLRYRHLEGPVDDAQRVLTQAKAFCLENGEDVQIVPTNELPSSSTGSALHV